MIRGSEDHEATSSTSRAVVVAGDQERERPVVVCAAGGVSERGERLGGDRRDEREPAARIGIRLGRSEDSFALEPMQRPVRGVSDLPLCLVAFDRAVAVDEELNVVCKRVDRLDGHRVNPSEESIQEVADGPATFEPRTELRCLSSCPRARSHLPVVV
jgi:hypothetical protein